jgi:hypothetical protein
VRFDTGSPFSLVALFLAFQDFFIKTSELPKYLLREPGIDCSYSNGFPNHRNDPGARVMNEKAIVIGASMSGLLAARVLSDFYDEVIILERDTFFRSDRKPSRSATRTPRACDPLRWFSGIGTAISRYNRGAGPLRSHPQRCLERWPMVLRRSSLKAHAQLDAGNLGEPSFARMHDSQPGSLVARGNYQGRSIGKTFALFRRPRERCTDRRRDSTCRPRCRCFRTWLGESEVARVAAISRATRGDRRGKCGVHHEAVPPASERY